MRLNLGCSGTRYPGYTNVDIAPGDQVDLIGSATQIPVSSNSVEVLYHNAVFEHIYTAHHDLALQEAWRVLQDRGVLIALSIPDFETTARLYLEGKPGLLGPRFDLFNAYRMTHGWPEMGWLDWRHVDPIAPCPPSWQGQLHKSLFDADYLHQLLQKSEFRQNYKVFRYSFKGDPYPLCLGFMAHKGPSSAYISDLDRLTPWVFKTMIGDDFEFVTWSGRTDQLISVR